MHTMRPELNADPGPNRASSLGYRVFPGSLAGTAHHQQITMANLMLDGDPASARTQQEIPR